MRVRKAVIPAAGFGTRFLPVTRTIPKVMLPVIDLPAIHYAVEEAAKAGIEHVVLVISRGQEATDDYFGSVPALEKALEERGNTPLLERMLAISNMMETSYVYQDEPLGLGNAVLMAKDEVGNEPFAIFLPDDIIWSDSTTIGKMIEIYDERGGVVISVKEVPDEAVPSLGIVDPEPISDNLSSIKRMVEKPNLEDAPSNLAIIGRYVVPPEIFGELERTTPGAIGEIQLTDALDAIRQSQGAYAYKFDGEHFDVGTPLGMLKASVYAALHRDDLAKDLKDWIKENI
jgi:UTP--glucose-1-phosphate uridylyltransferase